MVAPKRKRTKQGKTEPQRKKLKGVQKPPPLPEITDDFEVTEEDLELVDQFKDHIGFLKDLDYQKLDKSIGAVVDKGPKIVRPANENRRSKRQNKEEEEDEDLEEYERIPRKELKESVDPGEEVSLPIKQLDGKIVKQEEEQPQLKADQLEAVPGVNVVDEWSRPNIYKHKLQQQKNKQNQIKQQQKQEENSQEEQNDDENLTINSEMFQEQEDEQRKILEQNKESVEQKYERLKTRIAVGCMRLIENPEDNIIDLRPIIEIFKDTDERIVALCMLSSLNVFTNIIPGYRIRAPTEQELQSKQKKDVIKVREYENNFGQLPKVFVVFVTLFQEGWNPAGNRSKMFMRYVGKGSPFQLHTRHPTNSSSTNGGKRRKNSTTMLQRNFESFITRRSR
eukprot:TRINITY_DN26302_c0_g2_i3.p1 TRINITY_DN26302_c0_g2~~TRINITY_DN26302_c0_g2_i3.p1  ORF type:complete len:394 (+),score=61.56 TRINITY_DN26302_c0_g2_i3:14-1195(+)